MLFNSHLFIFFFLPVCLGGFALLGRRVSSDAAMLWLVVCSLFFYGWWNPFYLWLIGFSIVVNFTIGRALSDRGNSLVGRSILVIGIVFNLGLLGYFKYINFFVDTVNAASGTDFFIPNIVLPLAISFFTFQQIAYLVDAYRAEAREYNFLHYCLFVTFFPQLIAGPIVHHSEMLPQFMRPSTFRLQMENVAVGSTFFILGLFKKVVLADGFAEYATPIFSAAESGVALTFFEGWGAALAYTLQLYFDFSGYSDMAIGLARLFGITLPMNFYSPYKARSIIDFWQRWHMTLSRFLRDYLYIPLGGNRRDGFRRYLNLMITMLLGGLWHGAGWTFVFWGGLHGSYLVLNHCWRRLALGRSSEIMSTIGSWLGRPLTFVAVVVGWVFFRAESYSGATQVLAAMAMQQGASLAPEYATVFQAFEANWFVNFQFVETATRFVDQDLLVSIAFGLAIVFWAPNTIQIMGGYRPVLDTDRVDLDPAGRLLWHPTFSRALVVGGVGLYGILSMTRVSEFLYFQF